MLLSSVKSVVALRSLVRPSLLLRSARPLSISSTRFFTSTSETSGTSPEPSTELPTEQVIGDRRSHRFQAETKQLLDIVARSLYTEKEVFVRELISNASDALEKLRYAMLVEHQQLEPSVQTRPLEISVRVDESARTITIQDTGIGMTSDELMENLGTIARSGSKLFLQQLEDSRSTGANIIGQFGVGFYSAFMVADKITVYSRSVKENSSGHCWSWDGGDEYTISEAENVDFGTKIIIHLKDSEKELAKKSVLENVIRKYSNFVGFPISLNGTRQNTVEAVWMKDKSSVSEDEHRSFYQFLSGTSDEPIMRLHFATDVPLAIKSIFYVPATHREKMGMGRQEMGINLYCKKVLIQSKTKLVLPEWMRFLKGAVDCEDLPLNISREHLQDSAVIRRISKILVQRVIKWLAEEGKRDPSAYLSFYHEFSHFIKEGVVTEFDHRDDLAKLLRYETSKSSSPISLDEYLSRMTSSQNDIYFLSASERKFAESSPYMEVFRKRDLEVIYCYTAADDFVLTNLGTFQKRRFINAETSELSLDDSDVKEESESPPEQSESNSAAPIALTDSQAAELSSWFMGVLSDKLISAKPSKRLVSSPAIVVEHESAVMRKMIRMIDNSIEQSLPKQKLEFNPRHDIIRMLYQVRLQNPDLATSVAEQVFDNALIAAGLLEDPRTMLDRLNLLLQQSLLSSSSASASPSGEPEVVDAEVVQ